MAAQPDLPVLVLVRRGQIGPTGTVASFVVVRRDLHPAFPAPFVVAHIAIDSTDPAVVVVSNVDGCPVESVSIGLPVRAHFEHHDTFSVPLFSPIAAGHGS